ncbi:MAG: Calx-beta domain-containing protein [Candidatus Promineifilaceae bacterium]|nr:Calx-beta domain-containing protein [Candidatus Promineifilaceae bacterium]
MNNSNGKKARPLYLLLVVGLALIPLILLLGIVSPAFGGTPLLPGPGYLDFSYADPDFDVNAPTGEKAESKLWWNDGYWWGSMYVAATNAYHIHRLQWGSQTWVDTGVKLDDTREALDPKMTKADTLWDDVNQKLYVVSHNYKKKSSPADPINSARLYRYSYDKVTQTYSLDPEFQGPPFVTVNGDSTEVLTFDKDSNGRLWVSYVSRPSSSGEDFKVYVNSSSGGNLNDDDNWGTPFSLPAPVPLTATQVTSDDISTIVSVKDHVAVVWSNQSEAVSDTLHLALHPNGSNPSSGWQYYSMTLPPGIIVDDHLSAKSIAVSPNGQVFVAVKLKGTSDNDPEIAVYALDTDGSVSFHEYSHRKDGDTRPITVIDESANRLYVFVSGKDGGSKICYKSLDIPGPGNLDSMGNFPAGDCGTEFIEDDFYKDFNNATSMKRNASDLTGIVVLAGDDKNGQFYGHNVMGNPPPVVDATEPLRGMIDAPLTGTVKAVFSKDMNAATINGSNFIVNGPGGQINGSVTYNAALKAGIFTPDQPLIPNSMYTVELTSDIRDSSGQRLNEGIETGNIRESWQFTTEGPPVHFESTGYTVEEGQQATVTVTLDSASAIPVMVDYKTYDLPAGELPPGTAAAVPGVDYQVVSDTLMFSPGETSQTFSVTTLDNAELDGLKALGLELSNPASSTLGEPNTAILTIFDDETPTVRFKSAEFIVDEGVGTAVIELLLSGPATTPVSVDFRTEDGTATAGEDYTAVTGETITFAPGDTSKNAMVTIIDDNLNELNETVALILENPSPAEAVIANSPATLVILDNDPEPQVQFKSDTITVGESVGKAIVDVTLSTMSGRAVTVAYETGGGTATPGVDYEPASGTLTFQKGQMVQSIEVIIKSDSGSESDETFNVSISNPDGGVLGLPNTMQVTIAEQSSDRIFLPMAIGSPN